MTNRHRGEVAAKLDGRDWRLCLTLGALAELEAAYAAENLNVLVERFSTGRLSSHDLMRLIGAGLRGAGHSVSDAEVGAMRCEDGAAGYARIAAELLTATFGGTNAAGEGRPDGAGRPQEPGQNP